MKIIFLLCFCSLQMLFIRLKLRGGKGGNGIISWEKTKRNSRLGPAGGDGGQGASIFFKCSSKLSDFVHLKTQTIVGENGKNGERDRKAGSSAEDIIISLPPKVQIYDLKDKLWKNTLFLSNEEYLVCRGGRGGRGNASFKNSQFQAPWLYELGEDGERKELLLVLENYYQIGIFSFPENNKLVEKLSSNLKFSEESFQLEFRHFPSSALLKAEPKEFFRKELELCKSFIFFLQEENQDFYLSREKIESKLRELGFNSFLTLCTFKPQNKSLKNFFYVDREREDNIVREWVRKEYKKLSYLPVFTLNNPNPSELEYIEYSDKLFPEKEALNITKTEQEWRVQSARLNYWTQRIPQTTLHNLERLRQKLKIEEINKEIKKMGGLRGEKLRIYNYSTQVY